MTSTSELIARADQVKAECEVRENHPDDCCPDFTAMLRECEANLRLAANHAGSERAGSMTAQWTYDPEAEAYYFTPNRSTDREIADVLAMKEAWRKFSGLMLVDGDPPSIVYPAEVDQNEWASAYDSLCAAIDRIDVKTEAKSQEPDAWQWRFKQQGQWSRWIDLLPDHVDSFRQIQSHNLKSGNCETRPLYTHPTTKPEAPAVSVEWHPQETAPQDGSHILVCSGPYNKSWGFNQSPPSVVHFFNDMEEPGFYLSSGIVQDSYNDKPVSFTHWRSLGKPPAAIAGGR